MVVHSFSHVRFLPITGCQITSLQVSARPPAGTSRSIAGWQFQKEGGGTALQLPRLPLPLAAPLGTGRSTVRRWDSRQHLRTCGQRQCFCAGRPPAQYHPQTLQVNSCTVFLEGLAAAMSWPVRPARGHGPGLWTAPAGPVHDWHYACPSICWWGDSCSRARSVPWAGRTATGCLRRLAGPQEATPEWGAQGTALIHTLQIRKERWCACGCSSGGGPSASASSGPAGGRGLALSMRDARQHHSKRGTRR